METTKGPWKYSAPQGMYGHEVISPDGLVCQTNHHPDRKKQAEGDAHLIAAAPDLLDALKAIHAHLSNGDNCPSICKELARAAIEKATQ